MNRLAAMLIVLLPVLATADEAQRQGVIDTIDAFFAAMTARDVDRMRLLMTPQGVLHGFRETEDGLRIDVRTHAEYLDGLADGDARLVERYWDADIAVSGRMATAWTPYDFHIDGQFSHCGINQFSLLRADGGWVIAGVVYSIRVERCAESPLGPYSRDDQR